MGSTPVPRKNKIEFMLSDEEYDVVVDMAKKEGVTLSEWVRMACMVTACFDGSRDAWRMTYKNASKKGKELVGRFFSDWGLKKSLQMSKMK